MRGVRGYTYGSPPAKDGPAQVGLVPRLGDHSHVPAERNAFLDLVLAARERLVLSYVGRRVRDNSRIPPSILVSELLEVLVATVAPDEESARQRLIVESASRDTYENAALSLPLMTPRPGEHWLLVTSAHHMPRAVGAFRRLGLGVIAYPVDFRTRGTGDMTRLFPSIAAGLMRLDLAVKEWLGLIAYRLSGRSSALFPAP